jgi:hypothetical protein
MRGRTWACGGLPIFAPTWLRSRHLISPKSGEIRMGCPRPQSARDPSLRLKDGSARDDALDGPRL